MRIPVHFLRVWLLPLSRRASSEAREGDLEHAEVGPGSPHPEGVELWDLDSGTSYCVTVSSPFTSLGLSFLSCKTKLKDLTISKLHPALKL